jgi:hypothetical protein
VIVGLLEYRHPLTQTGSTRFLIAKWLARNSQNCHDDLESPANTLKLDLTLSSAAMNISSSLEDRHYRI